MNGLGVFLTMTAGVATDPLALLVLAGPGLLHRRWWPRLLWAAGWAALVVVLLGAEGPYGAARPLAAFAGALVYMSMLYGARRLAERPRRRGLVAPEADRIDAGDV